MVHCMRMAVILLAAMALAAGPPPLRADTPAKRPVAHHAAGQTQRSDARIEADIRARLAKSVKLSADHFRVHVQGGVATFEGNTNVVQHKGVATRMAKSAGATAVVNHIQISDAAREKAAANLEKGRRRAQIKRSDARSQATRNP